MIINYKICSYIYKRKYKQAERESARKRDKVVGRETDKETEKSLIVLLLSHQLTLSM